MLDRRLRWLPLADGLAAGIHPERWALAGLPAEGVARLLACPRSLRTLSRGIGAVLPGVDGEWSPWNDNALDNDAAGWALFSGEALWRSALRLGAARRRADIIRIVLRQEVAALKNAIGEDAHRFAVRQAPSLWRELRLDMGGPEPEELAESVFLAAGFALGCWLATLPTGLAARVRITLPIVCDGPAETAASWPTERREAWHGALARLFSAAPAPE